MACVVLHLSQIDWFWSGACKPANESELSHDE